MSLMLSRETARLLYDLAFASKKDPSDLLAELVKRAAEEQNGQLQQQLDETRLHYRRLLLERGRELGEATSALGIIMRELLAARENSEALRQALPSDFSEPGSLAKAIRTLCDIATRNAELLGREPGNQR